MSANLDSFAVTRVLFLLWLLAGSLVIGFSDARASEEPGITNHEAEHKQWAAGVFLGGTEVDEDWESTLGFEVTYHINPKWSTFALLERSDRQKDTTLGLLGLGFHPWRELILIAGVGRKDPAEEREYVMRLGVAYEIHLGHDWYIEPFAGVDTIEHEDKETVLGVYLGRKF